MDSDLKCCICQGSRTETEILDSGPADISIEEEEKRSEEEVFDAKKMKLSFICMQKMVDKYLSRLSIYLGICPTDPCIDDDIELNCSKNKEICKLQRDHHCLKTQIHELVSCCKTTKSELKNLHSLVCDNAQKIQALQKHVAALESWRRTLELEAGLCIERFEYLKHVKAEWSEVVKMLEKDKTCFAKKEEKFMLRTCYAKDKVYFIDEVKKLRRMFTELYELQNTKFTFTPCPDTPTRELGLSFAEKEYVALKTKFNERKYGKETNDEKDECK